MRSLKIFLKERRNYIGKWRFSLSLPPPLPSLCVKYYIIFERIIWIYHDVVERATFCWKWVKFVIIDLYFSIFCFSQVQRDALFRKKHNIHVSGSNIPSPLQNFVELRSRYSMLSLVYFFHCASRILSIFIGLKFLLLGFHLLSFYLFR